MYKIGSKASKTSYFKAYKKYYLLGIMLILLVVSGCKKKTYSITFRDSDHTILRTIEVEKDEIPVFVGTPEKESDDIYDYVFFSWDKDLVGATEDTEYIAVYKSTLKNPIGNDDNEYEDSSGGSSNDNAKSNEQAYYVSFLDDTGTILQKSLFVSGTTPYYKAGTPSSKIVGDYIYTFSNWDKTIVPVTGSAEYKAVYAMQSITNTLPSSVTNPESPIKQCKVSLYSNNSSYGYCTGGGSFDSGSEVTIKAIPNPGYVFLYWKEDGSSNPERSFVAKRDVSFTAVFGEDKPEETENRALVSVIIYPDNAGYVEGVGSYPIGTLVTLTAKPNSYKYVFESWNSNYNINNIYNNSFSFVVENDTFFNVNFVKSPDLLRFTASSNNVNMGTISIENKEDDDLYAFGSNIKLVATPNENYQFDCWRNSNNEVVSTSSQYTHQILKNDELKAYFEEKSRYPINITVSPEDAGKVILKNGNINDLFLYGTKLELEASANPNYVFAGWDDLSVGDYGKNSPNRSVEVTKTNNFVARFNSVDGIFKQLEYIDCVGENYFDTGFKPNSNTRVVIEGADLVKKNDSWISTSRDSSSTNMYEPFLITSVTSLRASYGSKQGDFTKVTASDFESNDFLIDMNKNVVSVKVGDKTDSVTFAAQTFSVNHNLVIFAGNSGGTISHYSDFKLKSYLIYDNGELVRRFIPVQRTSDSVAGLYDTVNNKFYRPAKVEPAVEVGEIKENGEENVANRYRITVTSNSLEKGTVSSSSTYAYEGDLVTINASAIGDYTFIRWSDGNTNASRSIEVHDNINLIAYFGSEFEKEYTIINGIKSSGTQYIDTEMYPSFYVKVVLNGNNIIQPTDNAVDSLFGSVSTDDKYRFDVKNADTDAALFSYGKTGVSNFGFGKESLFNSKFNITVDINSSTLSVNSNDKTVAHTGTANPISPLYLFANNNGTSADSFSSYTLTGCQIYTYSTIDSNYTLERDFIPVKKNDTGKIGLYDRVNNKFYTNKGTGDFSEAVSSAQARIFVSANDNSLGTVTGSGVFDVNTAHIITAEPKQNCVFIKWSDGDTNATRTITPTEAKEYYYTAIFGESFEDQYTILDSIETDGNQYINLDIAFQDGYSIEAFFKPTRTSESSRYLFGTADSPGTAGSSADGLFGIVASPSNQSDPISFSTVMSSIEICNIDCSDGWVTYSLTRDSEKKYTATINSVSETSTYTNTLSNYKLYLFNNANIESGKGFVGKLNRFAILDSSGSYKMDLVPVSNNNTHQVGLYDRVSKKFYVAHSAKDFVDNTKTSDAFLANYTKLNSISSTELGNQYIKTGIKPSSKTRVVLNIKPKSSGTIFNSQKDSNGYSLVLDGNNSYLKLGSSKFTFKESDVIDTELSINVYQGISIKASESNNLIVSSESQSDLTKTFSTIDDEITLCGKSSLTDFCVMDISSVSIYEESKLVRNYIPVINSDNRIGLLDTVNKQFYDNANPDGSSFVANKDSDVLTYTNLNWITLDSNNYVDTGVKGGTGTGISVNFEPLNSSNGKYLGVVSNDKTFAVGADFEADKGYYVTNSEGEPIYLSDSASASSVRKVTIDFCYSGLFKSSEVSSSVGSKDVSFADELDNIYIGKVNGLDGSQSAKYYSVKIKKNGVLVRDFIPVLNNETKKIGLYDKVNRKFYAVCEANNTNKSSKALNKGDVIVLDGQTKGVNDKYLVIGFKDGKALLMSQNAGIKADFDGLSTTSFDASSIGLACKNFYNSINGTNKEAIVPVNIDLNKHAEDNTLKKDSHVSTAKLDTASIQKYASYSNVYVYPVSISDIENYFVVPSGSSYSLSLTSQGLKELFPVTSSDQYIRLFSLVNDDSSYLVYYDYAGGVTSNYYISSGSIKNDETGSTKLTTNSVFYPAFLYDYNGDKASYHLYSDDYNSIEYVENRSNQYIDLGIACDQIKSIDLRFAFTKTLQDQILFGAYSSTNGGSNYAQYINNKLRIYGDSTASELSANALSLNTIYRVTTPVTATGTAYLYNESNGSSLSKAITKPNKETLNLYLFTRNDNGHPSPVHNTMMKVYSLKLYGLDGNIIMNLKPVERSSDHVIGFLDEVTGKFFTDSNINGKFYKGDYQTISNKAVNIYEKLDCITSTGTQYIDTGVVLPRESKIETKFITSSINPKACASMFGSYDGAGKPWTHLMAFGNMYYADKYINNVFENNKIYTVISDFDSSNNWYVKINETEQTVKNVTADIDTGTYKLFASSHVGKILGKGSIYYFKIWTEKELLFDLIPVRRMSDGVVGMLDTLTNKFFTNKGTGSFTGTSKEVPEYIQVQDDYLPVEYIESSGNEYIDTEVSTITNNTRVVVTAMALEDAKSIFGINGANESTNMFHYTGTNEKDRFRFAGQTVDLDKIYRRQIYTYDLYKGLKITDSTGSTVVDSNYGKYTDTMSCTSLNLFLFARNGETGANDMGRSRIYSCQIYDSGNLIRDFIPVRRLSDNELGMYDKVQQKFYSNASGSGQFTSSSLSANILSDYSDIEKYYISGVPNDYSMGTVSGSGSYNKDDTVTLIATPNSGYRFSHWSDSTTSATKVLNAESSMSYIAYFERLPVKGDIITLNDDNKYRVINVEDNQYLVVKMGSIGKRQFNSTSSLIGFGGDLKGGSYVSSSISRYLSDVWYSRMINGIKSSVIQTVLKQSYYALSSGNSLWYKDGVTVDDTVSSSEAQTYSFVKKSSNVITTTQNAFLLDVDDIFKYFGDVKVSPQELIEFFTGDPNALEDDGSGESKYNILLRSASNKGYTSLSLKNGKFNEVDCDFVGLIYPAFIIDINNVLLSYSIENPDIYVKKSIVGRSNDEYLGTVTGSGRYADGTTVTLKAIPNPGCKFEKWLDNDSRSSERQVTVSSDKEYTAVFSQSLPNKGDIIELADYANRKYSGCGEYTVLSINGSNAVLLSRDYFVEPTELSATSPFTDYKLSKLNTNSNIDSSSVIKNRYSSNILNAIIPSDIYSKAYTQLASGSNAINIDYSSSERLGSNSPLYSSYALDISDIAQFFGVNASTISTIHKEEILELFNLSSFPYNYLNDGFWLRSLVKSDSDIDKGYYISKDGSIYVDDITKKKASCFAFTIDLDAPNIAYKLKGALSCTPDWVSSSCTVIADSLGGGHVAGAEEQVYNSGRTLFLSAVADNGYVFSKWTDGVTTPTRSITTTNKTLHYTAVFTKSTTLKKGLRLSLYREPNGKQNYTILDVNGSLLTLMLIPDNRYVKEFITPYNDTNTTFNYFNSSIDKYCTSFVYSLTSTCRSSISQLKFTPHFYNTITLSNGKYTSSTFINDIIFEENRKCFSLDITMMEKYFNSGSSVLYSNEDLINLLGINDDSDYCIWLASQKSEGLAYDPYIIDNKGNIVAVERTAKTYNGHPIIACPVIILNTNSYGQNYFIY